MQLPVESTQPFTPDLRICRLLNGMWQVSGAHGRIDPQTAVREMFTYHDAGFTTWDLADHYGPAEDFIGAFRRQLRQTRGDEALADVQAFTKWVPRPGPMTRQIVEENIDISRRRMDVSTLDLLQFHWWEYSDSRYLDALTQMTHLRDEGKIRHLALTNFDTERLRRILDHGIRVVSNQVQYSLIDRRPEVAMAPLCQEHGVHLLAYGTFGGGLISETYLGQPEPRSSALGTASLRKYKQMIDAWGGWELFQTLLETLQQIADKHGVSIANVAVRAILDRPAVAGVIVGARLRVAEHRADNARVFDFTLDAEDNARIQTVLEPSRDLYRLIGDCGDEYRRWGTHTYVLSRRADMSKIAIVVEFQIKSGRCEDFLAIIREHAAGTLAEEEGCLQFDVLLPKEGEDRVLLYEVYRDDSAFQVHGRSARLATTRSHYADIIENRIITLCTVG